MFVVGCLGDWRRAAAVLFESESLRRDTSKGKSKRKEVADTLGARAKSGGGFSTEFQVDGGLQVAKCLNAKGGSGRIQAVSGTLGANHGNIKAEHAWTNQLILAFSSKDYAADAGSISPTLRAMNHSGSHANAGGQVAVAFAENSRSEVRLEGGDGQRTGALSTGGGKAGQGTPMVQQAMKVRRLTPEECERLQGIPSGWTAIKYRGKPACDGPRYKAIGNSMAVPVMAWIGNRLAMVDSTKICDTHPT